MWRLTLRLPRTCTKQRLRIAALGSSFASGPNIHPLENAEAQRSKRNYAHQLAVKLDAELTDVSVAGATLMNVLKEPQSANGVTFPPQVDSLPTDLHIITVTCGGNDLNYVGDLMNMTERSTLERSTSGCLDQPGLSRQSPKIRLEQLTERYTQVLDKIHSIAPKAKVYLVEYLSIMGNDTSPPHNVALSQDSVRHFEWVASILAKANEDIAAKFPEWIRVVPVAEASKGHALGSPTPWVHGFSTDPNGPAPYHPNLEGHTAVADMLYKQIQGEER